MSDYDDGWYRHSFPHGNCHEHHLRKDFWWKRVDKHENQQNVQCDNYFHRSLHVVVNPRDCKCKHVTFSQPKGT